MQRTWRWFVPLAVLAYLLTGLAQVGPDERGLVRRFGRVVARPEPGLWIGLPWGFESIERVQVRAVRQLGVGYNLDEANDAPGLTPGQYLTGDQNLVNARVLVEYAIDDHEGQLDDYLMNRQNLDQALSRETETLLVEWMSAQSVDTVLTGRAALALFVNTQLPERLQAFRLGIVVQRVSVESLAAPEEVREAFEAVNQAQTNIRTRRNQAEQEAARQKNDSESLALRLEREAQASAHEKLTGARAEATAFMARLEQYRRLRVKNPDIRTAIWREEMGKVLAGVRERGRIEVLDEALGPNGIELNQFLTPKKK